MSHLSSILRASYILLWCLVFVPAATNAVALYLFDGGSQPEAQGWTRRTGAGHLGGDITTALVAGGTVGGLFQAETSGAAFNHYGIDTASGSFAVTMRAAVAWSSHNYADAGFFLGVVGFARPDLGVGYVEPNRLYSLYIDTAQIGFWDDGGGIVRLDTSAFHEYGVLYNADVVSVFIDATLDAIVDGTALPVLQRAIPGTDFFAYDGDNTEPAFQRHYEGILSFGDWTNDLGVNSKYSVDYVRFQELAPRQARAPVFREAPAVPAAEPSVLVLMVVGLLALSRVLARRPSGSIPPGRGWPPHWGTIADFIEAAATNVRQARELVLDSSPGPITTPT